MSAHTQLRVALTGAAYQQPLVQGSASPRHETGVGRGPGGVTRNGAAAAPAFRLRDVVPAAVVVVLLLGMAGCMGALGGGPLDGTPAAIDSGGVAHSIADDTTPRFGHPFGD